MPKHMPDFARKEHAQQTVNSLNLLITRDLKPHPLREHFEQSALQNCSTWNNFRVPRETTIQFKPWE
jgi:hypothetical protein